MSKIVSVNPSSSGKLAQLCRRMCSSSNIDGSDAGKRPEAMNDGKFNYFINSTCSLYNLVICSQNWKSSIVWYWAEIFGAATESWVFIKIWAEIVGRTTRQIDGRFIHIGHHSVVQRCGIARQICDILGQRSSGSTHGRYGPFCCVGHATACENTKFRSVDTVAIQFCHGFCW